MDDYRKYELERLVQQMNIYVNRANNATDNELYRTVGSIITTWQMLSLLIPTGEQE